MTLKEHVILGGGAAGVLAPILGVEGGAVFWASSVLIDVDHYWDFLYRNGFRNWNPQKMFAFHRVLFLRAGRPDFLGLNLFHTVEFFLFVYLAGAWLGSGVVLAAFLGLVFHLGLDLTRLAMHRMIFARALSVVEYVIRRRRLVARGVDPNRVYEEALVEIGVLPSKGSDADTRGGSVSAHYRTAVPSASVVCLTPHRIHEMALGGSKLAASSFTVIVPALNEEDNLRPTVQAILKEIGPLATFLEVFIFDDASTDRTGAIADELAREDERVRVFHNHHRLNIGGIYKAGVADARGDYVFLVPGDNETRVDEIARGICALADADLLIFHVTNSQVRRLSRRVLSHLYVWIVNLLFSTCFRYTNGTNIFRTAVVRAISIRTNGFSYQTEAVVKAVRSGVDFISLGIELQTREAGVSKAISWRNLQTVAAALGRLWWEVNVAERGRYGGRGRRLPT